MMEFEALRQTIADRFPHLSEDDRFDLAVASYEKTHQQPDYSLFIEECAKKLREHLKVSKAITDGTRKAVARVYKSRIAGSTFFYPFVPSVSDRLSVKEVDEIMGGRVHV